MAKTYSLVSYGSKGDDVKDLQKLLNSKGYSLSEDGIFGKKTQAAVKDYQSKNNLQVDGIAGEKTWGSLTAQQTQAPAAPETGYTESDELKSLAQQLESQKAAAPGSYQFSQSARWDALIDQILGREDFSYDVNADALYQQYKDQYTAQGKLAMLDTMGQAATKTGGYGNSYAQTAGQQAYQGYLQKLNAVVPELYQLAAQRYADEGQALYDRYDLLRDKNETEYAQYRDNVDDYNAAYDRLLSQYDSQRAYEYSQHRDSVSDAQWQQELTQQEQQFALEYALKQEQVAAARQKASSTAEKEGISVNQYNAIHEKCMEYSEMGREYLRSYLQGLVDMGSISKELAYQIMESYFPGYEEKLEIFDV